MPEVVTLTEFDRLPSAAVTFSRRNVFKRDRFTCQYCGKQPGGDELTIDHVVPRAQGGESSWTNCVVGMFGVQQAQGGPNSGAGQGSAPQGAGPTNLEAALLRARLQDGKLVEVHQRGVLER